MCIRVVLADDHTIVRENLRVRLQREADIEVAGEAGDGFAAIELAQKLAPDIVIMDVSFPRSDIDGVETTRQIIKHNENIRVLALSAHDDLVYIKKILSVGASGYLLKGCSYKELLDAIRKVYDGQACFSEELNSALLGDYLKVLNDSDHKKPIRLSAKEREVLQLIAKEHNPKEIAQKLQISPKTVATHRLRLQRKLGIFTEAGLTKYAIREGFITPHD